MLVAVDISMPLPSTSPTYAPLYICYECYNRCQKKKPIRICIRIEKRAIFVLGNFVQNERKIETKLQLYKMDRSQIYILRHHAGKIQLNLKIVFKQSFGSNEEIALKSRESLKLKMNQLNIEFDGKKRNDKSC